MKRKQKKVESTDESSTSESEQSATASTQDGSCEESSSVESGSSTVSEKSGDEVSEQSAEEEKNSKKTERNEVEEKKAEDTESEEESSSNEDEKNSTEDVSEKNEESESDESDTGTASSESQPKKKSEKKNAKKEEESAESDEDVPEKTDNKYNTVFVKGFDKNVTELMIEEEFGKIGKVVGVRMPKDKRTSENKGFCYVEFSSQQSAKKALAMHGKKLLDCQIVVDTPNKTNDFSVFVNNIPFTSTVDDLKDVFSGYKIKNVRLPTDEDGERNRGFCFVELETEKEMKKFLNGNFKMDNRKLFVREAKERRDRDNRGYVKNDDRKRFGGNSGRNGAFDKENRQFNRNDDRKGGNFRPKNGKRVKDNGNKKVVFEDSSD